LKYSVPFLGQKHFQYFLFPIILKAILGFAEYFSKEKPEKRKQIWSVDKEKWPKGNGIIGGYL